MKHRIFKKLCKKSAELLGINRCSIEDDGIYHVWEHVGGECDEYDSKETWFELTSRYIDENSQFILSGKNDWDGNFIFIGKPVTPKNVFNWAVEFFNQPEFTPK